MGVGQELAVLLTVGIERPMTKSSLQGNPLTQEVLGTRRKVVFNELLPDILDSLIRRMKHVIAVETVVAQFVHHDFVGGEIDDIER